MKAGTRSRLRAWRNGAIGAVVTLGVAIALPVGFAWTKDEPDIRVEVEGHRPFGVQAGPQMPLKPSFVGPEHLRGRLIDKGDSPATEPGLHFQTYRLVYGGRWEREITWPLLVGPFEEPQSQWPCALGVILRPEIFDDGKQGGGDVADVIDHEIRKAFPIGLDKRVPAFIRQEIALPKVKSTEVKVILLEQALDVEAEILFVDGATVAVDARIRLVRKGDDLGTQIERVRLLRWTGPTGRGLLRGLVGSLARQIGKGTAAQYVRDHVARSLSPLKLPAPAPMLDGRPNDALGVAMCGEPDIDPQGVRLPLRLLASLNPVVDPAIAGPYHLPTQLRWPDKPSGRPLEVIVPEGGLNQMMYLAWQTGLVQSWAKNPELIANLSDRAADRLNFELNDLDPRMPPTLVRGSGKHPWRIRLADVHIGDAGRREVLAHADMLVKPRGAADTLGFVGTIDAVAINCAHLGGSKRWVLTPCLSDVIPLLRDDPALSEPIDFVLEPKLLAKMTRATFADYAIRLDGVTATGPDRHGQMWIQSSAAITPVDAL